MKVWFKKRQYELIITDHARFRMSTRDIALEEVIEVVEKGKVKEKKSPNKYWVYKDIPGREDNSICLSVVLENPKLIIITALVAWSPRP